MLRVLREWAGVIALVLVLAGGTAYAANEWTGTNIVNESLTGLDIKADTVKGGDVVEPSLAKVPNADKLDNVDSSGFVQGGSAVPGVFGTSQAKTYFSRVTSPGGISTALEVPGLLHLRLRCEPDFAAIGVISDVAGLEVYSSGMGRDELHRDVFAKDGIVEFAATPTENVQELLLQAGTGANTFGGQKLVDITVHWALTAEGDCTATASAIDQRT